MDDELWMDCVAEGIAHHLMRGIRLVGKILAIEDTWALTNPDEIKVVEEEFATPRLAMIKADEIGLGNG